MPGTAHAYAHTPEGAPRPHLAPRRRRSLLLVSRPRGGRFSRAAPGPPAEALCRPPACSCAAPTAPVLRGVHGPDPARSPRPRSCAEPPPNRTEFYAKYILIVIGISSKNLVRNPGAARRAGASRAVPPGPPAEALRRPPACSRATPTALALRGTVLKCTEFNLRYTLIVNGIFSENSVRSPGGAAVHGALSRTGRAHPERARPYGVGALQRRVGRGHTVRARLSGSPVPIQRSVRRSRPQPRKRQGWREARLGRQRAKPETAEGRAGLIGFRRSPACAFRIPRRHVRSRDRRAALLDRPGRRAGPARRLGARRGRPAGRALPPADGGPAGPRLRDDAPRPPRRGARPGDRVPRGVRGLPVLAARRRGVPRLVREVRVLRDAPRRTHPENTGRDVFPIIASGMQDFFCNFATDKPKICANTFYPF